MLNFCLIDATVSEHSELPTYLSDKHVPNTPAPSSEGTTAVRCCYSPIFVTLFGRREDGTSVAVVINNWRFHFFIELSDDQSSPSKLEPLVASLQNRLRNVQLEFVRRHKAVGFHPASSSDGSRKLFSFLKVSFCSLNDAFVSKKILQQSGFVVHEADSFSSKHRNVFIVGQLMEYLTEKAERPDDDGNGNPCSWFSWISVSIDGPARPRSFQQRYTHCTEEVIVRFQKLSLLPNRALIPPLRLLSYDIECYSPDDNVFPVAETCPIIAIGNTVYQFNPCGVSEFVQRICFSYAPCPGSTTGHGPLTTITQEPGGDDSHPFELRVFSSELEMLEAWRDYLVFGDFDILTGYNIWKFDVPYLMDRVKTLAPRGSRFFRLGKIMRHSIDTNRKEKPQSCSSTSMGDNDIWLFNAPGIAEIDVYMLAKRFKTTSLKLKDVSKAEIGVTKVDLPYSEINVAFRAGQHARIADYCIHDTFLPVKLIEKWGSLNEFIAVSRATYTPIMSLASGGQQLKVRNLYFQMGHSMNFVFNTHKFSHGDYQGATVITPKPGYYTFPVATLDFASLYPSCMMKDNLCSSTLVIPEISEFTESLPCIKLLEHRFVQHVPGIVPTLLNNLLTARATTQRLMAEAKRAGRPDYEVVQLDHRQLSLKLCANSVYGFFNTEGIYKCMAVAESTTCAGRQAIERAQLIAEGAPYCCEVIYGDTDSIMVRIPGARTVLQASDVAVKIADSISSFFDGKLNIIFEKAYLPYLLVKKKRYAGQMYSSPTAKPKLDCKGFEIVRRDSFPLCHELQRRVFDILIAPVPEDTPCLLDLAENRRAAVFDLLQEIFRRFLLKQIEVSELVMSKSLKRKYANEASVVQAVVNAQIRTVTPGREFPPGDRVPFIIVNGDVVISATMPPLIRSRSANITNRAVFVDFVQKFEIFSENIDWVYYIERLRPTVLQIMQYVSASKLPLITSLFSCTIDVLRRSMRTFADISHRDIGSFFSTNSINSIEPAPSSSLPDPPIRVTVGPSSSNSVAKLPKRKQSPTAKNSKIPQKVPRLSIMSFFGKK